MDFLPHSGNFAVPALHGLTGDDASARELKKARIREEILAHEADEDGKLREEVRREIELERQMAAKLREVQLLGLLPPSASLKSNWFISCPPENQYMGEMPQSEIEATMAKRLLELQSFGPVTPTDTVQPVLHPEEARVGEKLRLHEKDLESSLVERLPEWQSLGLVGHTPGIYPVPYPTETEARVEEELRLHETELERNMAERLQEVQRLGLLPPTTTLQTLLNLSDRQRHPISVPLESDMTERLQEVQSLGLLPPTTTIQTLLNPSVRQRHPISVSLESDMAERLQEVQRFGLLPPTTTIQALLNLSDRQRHPISVPPPLSHRPEAELAEKPKKPPGSESPTKIGQKAPAKIGAVNSNCFQCGQSGHRFADCHVPRETCHVLKRKAEGDQNVLSKKMIMQKPLANGEAPLRVKGKCFGCGEKGHRISRCRLSKQETYGKAPHGFTSKCFRCGKKGHRKYDCIW